MIFWWVYFLSSWLATFLLVGFLVFLKSKYQRKIFHRLGGLAIGTVLILEMIFIPELIFNRELSGFLAGIFSIVIFGFFDDWLDFSWHKQLVFQFFLVGILIFAGFEIFYFSNPFGGVIRIEDFFIKNFPVFSISSVIICFWTIFSINAMNWADGIDGLSGGIGILGAVAIFGISLTKEVNQPAIAIIGLILVGALLGFWWWNFPPGKIEIGTSGSYLIGFSLSALSIISGTKIATALLVFSLPFIDACWVIFERIKSGKSIFQKEVNQRHLHYKLRMLGWSDRKIAVCYLGMIILSLLVAFIFESRVLKFSVVFLEFLAVGLFIYCVNQKTKTDF